MPSEELPSPRDPPGYPSSLQVTQQFLTEIGEEVSEWRDEYGGAREWLEKRSSPEAALDGITDKVWDAHLRKGERLRMRLTEQLFSSVAPHRQEDIQDCWADASSILILIMDGIDRLSFELY